MNRGPKPSPLRIYRDLQWIDLYRAGRTLQEIGDMYGVSRERVRQRLAVHGLNGSFGGRRVRTAAQGGTMKQRAVKAVEARYRDKWGVERGKFGVRRGNERHPISRYARLRENCRKREIIFTLTFPEWWRIWQESGHYDDMGPGRYIMARIRCDGPYSADNVRVCPNAEASSAAYEIKPAAMRMEKRLKTLAAQREAACSI